MVITENDSDEILTLDRTSITIAERDHAKEIRAVSSRQEISQEKNPLPYSKPIQIRTNICQDEHKTLEQRTESSAKPKQTKPTPAQPKKKP
jgi:hypothetical protein